MPRSPASSQVGGRNAEGGGPQPLDGGQKPADAPPPQEEEDEDEDDEDRVLEICGKWQKLNQQVKLERERERASAFDFMEREAMLDVEKERK